MTKGILNRQWLGNGETIRTWYECKFWEKRILRKKIRAPEGIWAHESRLDSIWDRIFSECTFLPEFTINNLVNFDLKHHNFPLTDTVNSQIDLHKAYGHVKTILFFIGYSRSRHTLLGSLLDAHPHMVIADETMAFARWSSKQDIWISSSIYAYYDTLFKSSQRVVSEGRRSQIFKGSVANTTSKFRYYVPNQWQGTFDRYIEVSRTWDLHLALKSRDPIGGACIRVLYIAEHTEGGQNMLQYRLLSRENKGTEREAPSPGLGICQSQ